MAVDHVLDQSVAIPDRPDLSITIWMTMPDSVIPVVIHLVNSHSSVAVFVGDGVCRHFALAFVGSGSLVVADRLNRLRFR